LPNPLKNRHSERSEESIKTSSRSDSSILHFDF